jgi:hypothetical protein
MVLKAWSAGAVSLIAVGLGSKQIISFLEGSWYHHYHTESRPSLLDNLVVMNVAQQAEGNEIVDGRVKVTTSSRILPAVDTHL